MPGQRRCFLMEHLVWNRSFHAEPMFCLLFRQTYLQFDPLPVDILPVSVKFCLLDIGVPVHTNTLHQEFQSIMNIFNQNIFGFLSNTALRFCITFILFEHVIILFCCNLESYLLSNFLYLFIAWKNLRNRFTRAFAWTLVLLRNLSVNNWNCSPMRNYGSVAGLTMLCLLYRCMDCAAKLVVMDRMRFLRFLHSPIL